MKVLFKQSDMHQLLEELIEKGIYIVRENDNLKIKFNGEKLPEDVLYTIRENKQELLKYLKKRELVKSQHLIGKTAQADSYPLSSAQKRLWTLYQVDGEGTAYNMPSKVFLDGKYDIDCFKKAVHATIDRHEILRTVFVMDDLGEVRQRVLDRKGAGFEIGYADLRGDEKAEEKAAAYIEADSYRPFDLENGRYESASI